MSVSLMVKEVSTIPLKISVCIPPESGSIMKGSFIAMAKARSKDELKALGDRMAAGEFENDDEGLLREMYTGFKGLGDASGEFNDEQSWNFVLRSKVSAQLMLLLMTRYYEGHNEARVGNSGPRR